MKLRPGHPARYRLGAVLAGLALAFALTACGGGGESTNTESEAKVSKQQWEAVQLGSTRAQVIKELGPPLSSTGAGQRWETLAYTSASPPTTVVSSPNFTLLRGRLTAKNWNDDVLAAAGSAEIGGAGYRSIGAGMTRQQVEAKLGDPNDRVETVSRAEGTTYCIHYGYKPNPAYAAEFCFKPDGTLESKYAIGTGGRQHY